ncbi:uncharacterized protein CTHT_0053550 [Thermochaetoides thermophila DSM 1495]|uniref:Mid2 domain-containing protein n=1 Tax=Chaetomium thermophilum (strain DSM 1495 / CBS 144.50 / IMI 039719) TaxID=759272 RepID=G0SDZ5_CHATD|nr:hypothetical protein CTHT_0053550 [Thermochaetoides thermophila DSM 1495]EGS18746.1 hypothetical protein CTHT_0053550 [Thermochaetoides thermophila DSM 1495]
MSTTVLVAEIAVLREDIAVRRATVVIVEMITSTHISTVDVTTDHAETQTNVIWVTVAEVAAAKRAVQSDTAQEAPRTSGHPLPVPRQAAQDVPTVTEYVTATTDVTSISSVQITSHATSVVFTTIYRTQTHVRNAQTTVDVTSTLTVISHPPATIVVTSTESVILTQTAPTPTASQPQPQPDPEDPNLAQPSNEEDPQTRKHRKRLSKHAIAGLATGGAILGLLLTALVVLSMRRRFRYLRETEGQAQDDDHRIVGRGYDYYAPKQSPSRNDDDGSVSTCLPAPAPTPPSPPPLPGPLLLMWHQGLILKA